MLVLLTQEGNQEAFQFLCEGIYPELIRYGMSLCQDKALVTDAVHDVLMQLTRRIRRLTQPPSFKPWCFKGLRWKILDKLRQRNRQPVLDEYEALSQEASDREPDENNAQMHGAIRQLRAEDRDAIYLFYQQDMSVKEIAHIQKVPPGTVKSRLHRARNQLKQALIQEA